MEERLERTWSGETALASLTIAFAVIGVFMAVVGLYAVVAQSVASRATEIGVRAALGANRSQIMFLVLKSGMTIVIAGVSIGMVLSAVLSRFVSAQLYGVNPRDPMIFGLISAIFIAIGLVACLAPSRRAATLDPVASLRKV